MSYYEGERIPMSHYKWERIFLNTPMSHYEDIENFPISSWNSSGKLNFKAYRTNQAY